MRLSEEIAALREELSARARETEAVKKGSSSSSAPHEQQANSVHDQQDVEALMKMINDLLDEFAEELGKFPKLTALAALGVGLAIGIVVGRQSR